MQARALVLAVAIIMAPLGARGADLAVWWYKGFYEQEDGAVREIIAAFEQKTGKQVELVQPGLDEIYDQANDALAAGRPPDFLFPAVSAQWIPQWAYDDRLADLEGSLRPVLDLFDADAIELLTMLNGSTGQRALYALPMGRSSNHVHVWNSLLERAGFTLADVPKEWAAFWAFWCDQVQPAVRKALGREDIWGVGLPMSAVDSDTIDELFQFHGRSVTARLCHRNWAMAGGTTLRRTPTALAPSCSMSSSRRSTQCWSATPIGGARATSA